MELTDQQKQSGYDQKAFLQIRLHELLMSIDKLSSFPAGYYHHDIGFFNCEILFRRLVSVFETIFSKLSEEEKGSGKEKREKIKGIIKRESAGEEDEDSRATISNIDRVDEELFEFRCLLEEFMDKHGFNPSKKDPRSAIIDM
jgi:hypothetical protein